MSLVIRYFHILIYGKPDFIIIFQPSARCNNNRSPGVYDTHLVDLLLIRADLCDLACWLDVCKLTVNACDHTIQRDLLCFIINPLHYSYYLFNFYTSGFYYSFLLCYYM